LGPFCAFVLTHKGTFASSSLTIKDLDKFKDLNGQDSFIKVPNQILFGDNYKAVMQMEAFLQVRGKICTALCSITTVVPNILVDHHFVEAHESEFLQGMIDSIVPSTSFF